MRREDAWFPSEEAREKAVNVLSCQAASGAWPKNLDTTVKYPGKVEDLKGTFDNGATVHELRFLARMWRLAGLESCRRGFEKGLDHVLDSQYLNGGWPQCFPPGEGYARYITLNDGTMVGLMELVREVAEHEDYEWVDAARRRRAEGAFLRGVDCLLRCQVEMVGGKRSVWCAQHDEVRLKPVGARSFELASLSGSESVGVVRLLMSVKDPDQWVRRAVEDAVEWFEGAAVKGWRLEERDIGRGKDLVMVEDERAPRMWARFYDLESGKPIFVDRDGVPKDRLDEIGQERRVGYAWYGDWAERLLAKDYPEWKARLGR